MYSSTPSFDSSFVLNDSGSSSTSPSRFPRMFVEYHPERPSMRALKAGARTVFIMVWPVLKSLPPIGIFRSSASAASAGTSTQRLGAPFAKGTFSIRAAYAYSIEGAMAGSFCSIAFSNAGAQLLGQVLLALPALDVGALEPLDVVLVEGGRQRLDRFQEIRDRFDVVTLQHTGLHRRRVGVIGERVPRGEHQVLQVRERQKILHLWSTLVGPLAEPDRPHLREGPDRQGVTLPDVLDPRDERGRDGPEAHQHHSQLALCGRDLALSPCRHHHCPFRSTAGCPASVSRLRGVES